MAGAKFMIRKMLVCALALSAMAVVQAGVAATPALAADVTGVSATASNSWQPNDTVRAMAVANGIEFVGGEFTSVRPPGSPAGTGEVTRNYFAAFNASTGDLITTFDPNPNGKVWAMKASPDGSRVYIGGDFTVIGGQVHHHLAAIDTSNLSIVSGWKPDVSYRVEDVAQYGDSVYFVGPFGIVNGVTRNKMAAVSATTATLLPWDPNADGTNPAAVAVANDGSRVFVGGDFSTLQGIPEHAFAAVDPVTGTPQPFPAQTAVPPITSSCTSRVRDIIVHGGTVYASAAGDGGGCFDGTFAGDVATGALVWKSNCLGATEAIQYIGSWLFKGSHAHDCSSQGDFAQNAGVGAANHFLLVQDPSNGRIGPWFPTTNAAAPTNVGPLAFATDGTQLFVGGDFTTVNGIAQAHLTRFAAGPETPPGKVQTPVAGAVGPGAVQVTFTSALDADDEDLTYNVYRQGTTAPIKTFHLTSKFWDIPSAQFTDSGLAPGSTVYYRVQATDGAGSTYSNWTSGVTVSGSAPSYQSLVTADGASNYWKLDDASGTTAADTGNPATRSTGTYANVTSATPSGVQGGTAVASFNGTNSIVSTAQLFAAPNTFTEEAWIKTTTRRGGRIFGYGDSQTGSSGNYDRHLYMRNDGRVVFGIYSGNTYTVTSTAALNDGKWHQLVGTGTTGSMNFYVDGVSQGTAAPGFPQTIRGYWRIGGDNLNGWPSRPTSNFFSGQISDVSTYPVILASSQIGDQYRAAGYSLGTTNAAPTASYTVSCTNLTCTFDGTNSSDSDGYVNAWAWDFGDGTTDTTSGSVVTHKYANAGDVSTSLTVTDNGGATNSVSHTASPTPPPNSPPTASFTVSCTQLDCSFNGTGSNDTDGNVVGYHWDFGDGTAPDTTSGATVTHSYTSAGDYTVTLTVTDNQSGTGSATKTASPRSVLASDTFSRTVTNGLGTADVGGAWKLALGVASRYSVSGGTGNFQMASAGAQTDQYLPNVSGTSVDTAVSFTTDKSPNGNGVYVSVEGRRIPGAGLYQAKTRLLASGGVSIGLERLDASNAVTTLTPQVTIPGLTYAAGTVLRVRIETVGTSPTTIQARVWRASDTEPSTWQVTATDSTSGLQAPGAIGMAAVLAGTATNAPVVASFSNLTAVRLS